MNDSSTLNDLSSTSVATGLVQPVAMTRRQFDSVVCHGSAAGTQIARGRQRNISGYQRSYACLS